MKKITVKEKIIKYKQEHPDSSYNEIIRELGTTKGMCSYALNPTQPLKTLNRTRKNRKEKPINHKVFRFTGRTKKVLNNRKKSFNQIKNNRNQTAGNKFTIDEFMKKIGNNPTCYLTGRKINLNNPSEYHLDHIIPVSKGGDNSLENCGLACKDANQSKTNMTPEEFILFCKEVLEYNGFSVYKTESNFIDYQI